MNWYIEVIKKYAVFSGRARRKEFWMFFLFNSIIMFVAVFIDFSISLYFEDSSLAIVQGLYSLAVLLPSLAVTSRRLHDIGRSGWWILISLVPFVGGIWLFVLTVTDSQVGENQYGPNPKNLKQDPEKI